MDGGLKVEGVNGAAPKPQRAQQGIKKPNIPQQKQNDHTEGAPAEKKARFNQNDQAQGGPGGNQNKGFGNNQNQAGPGGNQNKGFGNNQNQGGPGGNQNKGFGGNNQNRGFGNRNRGGGPQNRGPPNQNQGNFQNQQNQNKPNQPNQPNQANPTSQPNQANPQKQPDAAKPAADAVEAVAKKEVVPEAAQTQTSQDQQQQPQNQQQQFGQNQRNQHQQRNQNQNQQNPHQNQNMNMNMNMNMNQQHNRNRGGGGGFQGGGHQGGGGPGGNMDNRGPGGNQGGQNRDRGGRGGRGGPGGGNQGNGPYNRGDEFFIGQRLRAIGGPTHELPPVEAAEEPKFSGRCRLYVGNLTNDITENELREMFKPYGEIGEIFCNAEKNFTFLKVDYLNNAQRAKRELDGTNRKGRQLRVRFAPNATILRVKNLTPYVSNELLYRSFEIFGPVERANVVVDDRGKSTGEGVIEFTKKSSANMCLRFCTEKCFFLTASLRPCVVEPFEVNEDDDGLPEKSINKKTPEFHHERGIGPRIAELGSFEHEYGTRWKQLHELFKTKQDALKRELRMEEEKLEAQMEYARYEHETELLRQELRKRESDNERKKMEWEMREKQAEEMRQRDEENMRRQQSEMQSRMIRQEEEMRRRQQENTLFMQAQQLNSLLDQQEGFGGKSNMNNSGGGGGVGGGVGGNNFDNFGRASNNSPFEFRDPISALLGANAGGGNNNNSSGNGPNNPQIMGRRPMKRRFTIHERIMDPVDKIVKDDTNAPPPPPFKAQKQPQKQQMHQQQQQLQQNQGMSANNINWDLVKELLCSTLKC